MTLRLFVALLAILTFCKGGNAGDKVDDIVKDIREILTSAKEGMPADYLEEGISDLALAIKDFINASEVQVTAQQAQTVIDEVSQALEFGAKDIQNPLKFQFHSMARAFRLLKGMADKLDEIQQNGSTENLYETLVATEATCLAIIESIKDIDDVMQVVDKAGGDDETTEREAEIARRKWCIGWKKRALADPARDVNKRKWCIGWDKRSLASDHNLNQRKWCIGWKRGANADRDVDKRKWCIGWDKRSLASDHKLNQRKWCIGWKRGVNADRDVDKRKWCIGWDKRSVVAED